MSALASARASRVSAWPRVVARASSRTSAAAVRGRTPRVSRRQPRAGARPASTTRAASAPGSGPGPVSDSSGDDEGAFREFPRDADGNVVDMDGNPGITITLTDNGFVEGGQLYAVQRVRNRMRGSIDGDNLEGEVFDSSEQEVLASENIVDTEQSVEPAGDSTTNRVHMQRQPDNSLGCSTLMASPGTYFPPHPVPPAP